MRIFHDLLMLHGHIADPRLARELAGVPTEDRAVEARSPDAAQRPPASPAPAPAAPRPCADAGLADAHFGRGITTLCATALSLFR